MTTTEAQQAPDTGQPDRKPRVRRTAGLALLEKYGLVVLLAAVIVVFSVLPASSAQFATMDNFTSIVGNQSVLALVALASVLPLISGQFDLSVGAITGLSCVAAATAYSELDAPLLVGALVAPLVGVVVGALNGLLVTRLSVNALIATIGTQSVIAAVILWRTDGIPIQSGIPDAVVSWGTGEWLGLPLPFYYLVVVGAVIYYALNHTPFGRYLYAAGSNRSAATLVGLNVDRLVFFSFVLAGALSGVAGLLLLARFGTANPTSGPNYLLPALAAVFLGATAFTPGKFNVLGTFLAVFFVAVLVNGLVLAGVESWIEQFMAGLVLILAVAFSQLVIKRRSLRST